MFDQIRLRRAITLLPARQAAASSGCDLRCTVYAPCVNCLSQMLGTTINSPNRLTARFALGSSVIQRSPIQTSWVLSRLANDLPTRRRPCSTNPQTRPAIRCCAGTDYLGQARRLHGCDHELMEEEHIESGPCPLTSRTLKISIADLDENSTATRFPPRHIGLVNWPAK